MAGQPGVPALIRYFLSRARRFIARWWGPEAITDITDIAEHDANR